MPKSRSRLAQPKTRVQEQPVLSTRIQPVVIETPDGALLLYYAKCDCGYESGGWNSFDDARKRLRHEHKNGSK